MIIGAVNAASELVIRLKVLDAAGQEQDIEAIVDTGFTGSLTLPPTQVAAFGLPWPGRSSPAWETERLHCSTPMPPH